MEDVTEDDGLVDEPADDEPVDGIDDDTEEVFDDPTSFVGQTVTVSGEVSEIIDESAFEIAGEDLGGEGLLVVQADASVDLEADTVVRVTGTVRESDFQALETDLGVEFDDALFARYEDEHLIVAGSVEVIDSTE